MPQPFEVTLMYRTVLAVLFSVLMLLNCHLSFRLPTLRASSRIQWQPRWLSAVSASSELERKWTNDVLVSGLNRVQDISVRVVSCKDVLQQCITKGNLSDHMGTALGELVVCGATLSSTLKGEETLQFNVVGPNPGESMVVVCDGEMAMRAKIGPKRPCAEFDYRNNDSMTRLYGVGGQFQCIRNHPVWKHPISGATALRNASLATNAAFFVSESEQRTAALMTSVKIENQKIEYALGALIERMPRVVSENGTESGDENLEMIIKNVESIQKRGLHSFITSPTTSGSAITGEVNNDSEKDKQPVIPDFYVKNKARIDINPDVTATLHSIMDEIFRNPVSGDIEECGMRWFKNPEYKCTCSVDKVWTALKAFSKSDLNTMVADGKGAEVRCEFCQTVYRVTSEEIGQKFQ